VPADQRQPPAPSLTTGRLRIEGRLPRSSNFTFLVAVEDEGATGLAVYKPEQGEQELWDFPPGLHRREVAAAELASALGWPRVPETIERTDAPYGPGSLQRFIEADFAEHYFTLADRPELRDQFLRIAVFDLVANNADRKSGHCLYVPPVASAREDEGGAIWVIDNALCFHAEPKLRTVIWELGGTRVPDDLLVDLARVRDAPPRAMTSRLDEGEVEALLARIEVVLHDPVLPTATSPRQYPWPLV